MLALPQGAGAEGPGRFAGSAAFVAGIPQGDFHDNQGNTGLGMGASFGWRPGRGVILLGIEGKFLIYGHESRREPFSPTIPDVTVDVTTDNNLVQAGGFLRVQPPTGFFRPYVDGFLGFNYLYTQTTIKSRGGEGDVASSTNFDDTVVAYGAGGGIMFPVYRRREPTPERQVRVESVLIDIGARYASGGEARYLKEGSIRRENGGVRFDAVESRTDFVEVRVGAALEF